MLNAQEYGGDTEDEVEHSVGEHPAAHQPDQREAESQEGPRAGGLVGAVLQEARVVLLGHGGSPSIMAARPRPPWGEG